MADLAGTSAQSPEALNLHFPDDEFVRQDLTIRDIASVLLGNSNGEQRDAAIRNMRNETDYTGLQWRTLHMFAIQAAQQVTGLSKKPVIS